MSEIKLQSDMVRKISELYPHLRGQIFHVPNQRNHELQAIRARAEGIFPGVADLLYFKEMTAHGFQIENCCKLIALEVKEPNSTHKLDHVIQQAEWGQILENNGGKYVIVQTVEQSIEVINENYENVIDLRTLWKVIKNCKSKTIMF